MHGAQLTKKWFVQAHMPTTLVSMKGLTHVTSIQSATEHDAFQSNTCIDRIIVQLLHQQELNSNLKTIDDRCSLNENLIGIDWLYSNSMINQTLFTLFDNATTHFWEIE
jgi:hypothetical protein